MSDGICEMTISCHLGSCIFD